MGHHGDPSRVPTQATSEIARRLRLIPAALPPPSQEASRRLQAARREASSGKVAAELSARLAELETETGAALAKAERENGGVYLQVRSSCHIRPTPAAGLMWRRAGHKPDRTFPRHQPHRVPDARLTTLRRPRDEVLCPFESGLCSAFHRTEPFTITRARSVEGRAFGSTRRQVISVIGASYALSSNLYC